MGIIGRLRITRVIAHRVIAGDLVKSRIMLRANTSHTQWHLIAH